MNCSTKMKLVKIILLCFLSFGFTSSADDNTITVTVQGISEMKGTIRLGLFNSAKSFPVTGKQYKGYVFELSSKKSSFKLSNIPKGKYAIGLFHDSNANEKMDKNFLGIPTEKYGFSNNARASFSAPSYESASFQHDGSTSMSIKIY